MKTTISKTTIINKEEVKMKKELISWGISLIVLGLIHLLFSGFLDPIWGGVIIILGILNLVIHHRGMFIANGIALILVGALNLIGSLDQGGVFWSSFGIMQMIWGVKEMKRFQNYKEEKEEIFKTKTV